MHFCPNSLPMTKPQEASLAHFHSYYYRVNVIPMRTGSLYRHCYGDLFCVVNLAACGFSVGAFVLPMKLSELATPASFSFMTDDLCNDADDRRIRQRTDLRHYMYRTVRNDFVSMRTSINKSISFTLGSIRRYRTI